ncbi:hypothetical protein GF360_03500 [candidate division WWE3 bacterium]|nr:hypothetical protein [candidate division WWE3 bacterium]
MNTKIKDYTRKEVEKILNEKNMTLKQFLKQIQKQGYLLHGSPNCNIEKFEPKEPGDLRGGWTTQKGVYATSSEQPIIFSLIHRDKVKGEFYFESGKTSDGKILYGISKDIKESNAIQPGCMYIFENEGFIENPNNPGEWMNPNPVRPVGKIPTELEDIDAVIRVVEIPPEDQDWENYEPKFLD